MAHYKKFILFSIFSLMLTFLAGCSEEQENNDKKAEGEHIWKNQTDALKSAKEMSKKMQQSLNQQQQTLEENE